MKYLKLLHTIRKHGTSYAIATAFFPKEIRNKVLLLYSFVRGPDNIVDEIETSAYKVDGTSNSNSDYLSIHYKQASEKLQNSLERLRSEYKGLYDESIKKSEDFVGFLSLCKENLFSIEDAERFYAAMISDCHKHRYFNMAELNQYMYGSAVIVGLMMNKLMGCNNALCNYHGAELADAMQLTNFLRDVNEDYRDLDRIYLPSEELAQFGLSHNDIMDLCNGKKDPIVWSLYIKFMKYMIAKCRDGYRKAEAGYQYLPQYARKPIALAGILYEGILDKIERNNYDIFTKSARTTLFDKLQIIRSWKNKKQ